MAKIHGSGTEHFLDQYRISCVLNKADLEMMRGVFDARTFCQNDKVIGQREQKAEFAGFADFGAGLWEVNYDTVYRAGTSANYGAIMGTTAGSRAFEAYGPLGKDLMTFSIGDVVGLAGDIPMATSIGRGLALHVEQAFTATGAQTGQNVGTTTATTDTFFCTIRVTAVSGSGSVVFAVQESSDNEAGDAYATITSATGSGSANCTTGSGTMTFTGTGIGRITTTSATEAYKRINITTFSSFTSVTATITVGVLAPA